MQAREMIDRFGEKTQACKTGQRNIYFGERDRNLIGRLGGGLQKAGGPKKRIQQAREATRSSER